MPRRTRSTQAAADAEANTGAEATGAETINIKIVVLGERVRDRTFPAGTTVRQALQQGQISTERRKLLINGLTAEPSRVLVDNDVITLVPQIKGG